jgi:hypothetical protein
VTHGFHHVLASVVTSLTCFRAEAAVLVHAGVTAALFSAGSAGLRTSGKLRLQRLRARASEAQQHRSGRLADVGTVEVEPDAARELADMRLGQAGIGAGEASLDAGEASIGTA